LSRSPAENQRQLSLLPGGQQTHELLVNMAEVRCHRLTDLGHTGLGEHRERSPPVVGTGNPPEPAVDDVLQAGRALDEQTRQRQPRVVEKVGSAMVGSVASDPLRQLGQG
jgi:hypothetical protein